MRPSAPARPRRRRGGPRGPTSVARSRTTARRWSGSGSCSSSACSPPSRGRSPLTTRARRSTRAGLGPSVHHLFGTTAYGEDVFSQLVFGTRQSILIAFAVGGLATLIAVIVGVSAGYLGGKTDGVLSLITDVILVIPIFPLIIVIAAYERNSGFFTLVVVLGVLGWSYGARQLRSQTLSLRSETSSRRRSSAASASRT